MELSTVEIPRTEARESYLEYRRQAKIERDDVARRELEQMAAVFRTAARENLSLIALGPTITRGGTIPRTLVLNKGMSYETRKEYLLPKLAVCVADARFAFTLGIERDGTVRFIDSLRRRYTYQRGRLHVPTRFELPAGYQTGDELGQWYHAAWSAMVPIVPPKHRPRANADLEAGRP